MDLVSGGTGDLHPVNAVTRMMEMAVLTRMLPPNDPSSATAAGNARSAATVAAKLPEPSDCPAGRRFAAALWLGHVVILSVSKSPNAAEPLDQQVARSLGL